MSCFKGRMKEYDLVSLDRFDGINLDSTCFFLSHCHSDHMVGLDSPRFCSHLSLNGFKLYCHPVSMVLLLSDERYKHLEPHIVPLDTNEPHILTLPPRKDIVAEKRSSPVDDQSGGEKDVLGRALTVTLINAGHCPGSVMFFFEGDEGNALYTGDFRLSVKDFPGMKHLLFSNGTVKPIGTVYYDSTFCVQDCRYIPGRRETFDSLIQAVTGWINVDGDNISRARKGTGSRWSRRVLLFVAAKYGHECLITALSRHFGMKVHVTKSKFHIYSQIGELRNHVTLDPQESPLHACGYWESESEDPSNRTKVSRRGKNSIPCCPEAAAWDPDVLTVKPSMMWFALLPSSEQKRVCIFDRHSGIQRILYSCHSSLTEVREFLKFLKPERAYPNVAPNRSSLEKVSELMADILPPESDASDLLIFSEGNREGNLDLGGFVEVKQGKSFKEWCKEQREVCTETAKEDEFELGNYDKKKRCYVLKRVKIGANIEEVSALRPEDAQHSGKNLVNTEKGTNGLGNVYWNFSSEEAYEKNQTEQSGNSLEGKEVERASAEDEQRNAEDLSIVSPRKKKRKINQGENMEIQKIPVLDALLGLSPSKETSASQDCPSSGEKEWSLSLPSSSVLDESSPSNSYRTPDLFESSDEGNRTSVDGSEKIFKNHSKDQGLALDSEESFTSSSSHETLPPLSSGKESSVEIVFERNGPKTPDLLTLSGGDSFEIERQTENGRDSFEASKRMLKAKELTTKIVIEISDDDESSGWLTKKNGLLKQKKNCT